MSGITNDLIIRLAQQKIQYEKEKVCKEEQQRREAMLRPTLFFLFLRRSLRSFKLKASRVQHSHRKKRGTVLGTFMAFEEYERKRKKRLAEEEHEQKRIEEEQYKTKVSAQALDLYLSKLTKYR